jgi:hypothetical protein
MSFPPYSLNSPLPLNRPNNTQEDHLNAFKSLNIQYGVDHIPFGNVITIATLANPCVVTVPNNRFLTGWSVIIQNMKGLNDEGETVYWSVNDQTAVITVSGDEITLTGIDTSNEDTYIADSGAITVTATGGQPFYGLHKQITFSNPIPNPDITFSGINAILFQKTTSQFTGTFSEEDKNNLFFQSQLATLFQLTGSDIEKKEIAVDIGVPGQFTTYLYGFKTPFGITINFGFAVGFGDPIDTNPRQFDLAIPYTSTHYFTVLTEDDRIGSSSERMKVTNTTLNQFEVTLGNFKGSASRFFSFLSWGK